MKAGASLRHKKYLARFHGSKYQGSTNWQEIWASDMKEAIAKQLLKSFRTEFGDKITAKKVFLTNYYEISTKLFGDVGWTLEIKPAKQKKNIFSFLKELI